jgi:lincosamide nucleotidyltransferase A/C/D/E
MTSAALVNLLGLLHVSAIPLWLDGGWGVDALLAVQTRLHKDVDLIVRVADVPRLLETLGREGFQIHAGAPPNAFVLADGSGLEVDVHAVVFDDEGNGVYRMENGKNWIYPAEGFNGHGIIDGMNVRCLSPSTQVLCHANGYDPTEKDFRDMKLIKERFGVALPTHLLRNST